MSKKDFKRYSSIENSDKEKTILHFLEYFPELKEEEYIAREKLDGANMQIFFEKGVDGYRVGKRSSFLSKSDSFFDIWTTLENYKEELEVIQKDFETSGFNTFRLYGEIYGPGINGRVNYGNKKKIAIFDAWVSKGEKDEFGDLEEQQFTQAHLEEYLTITKTDHLLPPLVGKYKGLNTVMALNEEFDSLILNEVGNLAEGMVIQPYNKLYRIPGRNHFILKKKSKNFKDKEDKGGGNKLPKDPLPEGTSTLCSEFLSYINENRVLDVFSKHGNIEKDNQIGEYIRYVLDDAKEDFWKDNPELIMTDKQNKVVFNAGKQIVKLLYAHL